jgi:hypothetical protein
MLRRWKVLGGSGDLFELSATLLAAERSRRAELAFLGFNPAEPALWPAADGWVKMSQNVNGVETSLRPRHDNRLSR